jgi:hypothetical protein
MFNALTSGIGEFIQNHDQLRDTIRRTKRIVQLISPTILTRRERVLSLTRNTEEGRYLRLYTLYICSYSGDTYLNSSCSVHTVVTVHTAYSVSAELTNGKVHGEQSYKTPRAQIAQVGGRSEIGLVCSDLTG